MALDDKRSQADVMEEEGKKRGRRGKKGSSKKELSQPKDAEEKKDPVTPTSDRPTRERKSVDRYSAPSTARPTPSKVLSIEKGSGTQLKEIPNVAFKLSKRKADENLQVLHTVLFGKKAKVHYLKRNIGQFSGFVWAENEEKQRSKLREKLDKCVKDKLVDFCDILNIQINKAAVKKEEISAKLLEFLESPHVTTDILLADKEQEAKKRKKAASGKRVRTGEVSKNTPAKRQKTPEGGKKRKLLSKSEDSLDDKVESPDAEDDSHEDSDNEGNLKQDSDLSEIKSDEEDKEENEPKEVMKKSKSSSKSKKKPEPVVKEDSPEKSARSPTKKSSGSTSKKDAAHPVETPDSLSKSKGPASKKQKVKKETPQSQSKDKTPGKKQPIKSPSKNSVNVQGKDKSSKKSGPEPSREDMLEVVTRILEEVDFNTATLSDILSELGSIFKVDLMHRKAEVKGIITEVINNMSDEEEDGDDEVDGEEKDDA